MQILSGVQPLLGSSCCNKSGQTFRLSCCSDIGEQKHFQVKSSDGFPDVRIETLWNQSHL